MNRIAYCLAKLYLLVKTREVNAAKWRLNRTLHHSRSAKEKIDRRYEDFLTQCKKREKAAVLLKRITRRQSNKPVLRLDLGIRHYIVQPPLSARLTRLDAETAVTRHRYGDWGEISRRRWRENNQKARRGCGKITSRYPLFGDDFFLVESDQKSQIALLHLEEKAA